MSDAPLCISMLDDALAEFGEDIQLLRLTTDDNGVQTATNTADCRANVRSHGPQELTPTHGEAPNTHMILSPTDLAREAWPGLPIKDDRVLYQNGVTANVELVSPTYVGGVLVRVDMECRQ